MIKMKSILLLLVLIKQSFMFSQELSVRMSEDMCICTNEQLAENKNLDFDRVFDCLSSVSEKYDAEVLNLAPKNLDSIALHSIDPYEQGRKLGYEMAKKAFKESQKHLINKCDSYFNFFLSIRQRANQSLKEKSKEIKIGSINKKIRRDPNIDLYFERGIYYLAKGNYRKAIKDFEMCAGVKSENPTIWYLLAQTYEKANKYEMAIINYEKSLKLKDDMMVKINYEISKRNWRESK